MYQTTFKPSFSLDMSWEIYSHLVAEHEEDVQALQFKEKIHSLHSEYIIFIDQLPGFYLLPSMRTAWSAAI